LHLFVLHREGGIRLRAGRTRHRVGSLGQSY
jgi:hypothetical protein